MKEKLTMPCTEQQWEQEIKPRIEKIEGVKVDSNTYQFTQNFSYIVNNYNGEDNRVCNTSYTNTYSRTLIPYDPDRFCASLGEEQPKWMPLTRGGYEYKIIREDRGDGYMNVEVLVKNIWCVEVFDKNGRYRIYDRGFDLIPYNPKQEAIKQQIALKEKELEELKAKLK